MRQHLFHGAHDPGKLAGVIEVRIHPEQREAEPGDKVQLVATLVNGKAGHKVPTGSAEERVLWLHVTARDAAGREWHLPVDAKGFEGEEMTIASSAALAYQDIGEIQGIAGFPGLPLAIALPARCAALVDSIGKKAAFLKVAAAAAANVVQVDVLAERAEDLAQEYDQREAWDIVTARAVGTLAEVAELGLPLARQGGVVVAWKSAGPEAEKVQREIGDAQRIIRTVGGNRPRIVEP